MKRTAPFVEWREERMEPVDPSTWNNPQVTRLFIFITQLSIIQPPEANRSRNTSTEKRRLSSTGFILTKLSFRFSNTRSTSFHTWFSPLWPLSNMNRRTPHYIYYCFALQEHLLHLTPLTYCWPGLPTVLEIQIRTRSDPKNIFAGSESIFLREICSDRRKSSY